MVGGGARAVFLKEGEKFAKTSQRPEWMENRAANFHQDEYKFTLTLLFFLL
jgi:hypothetical protein